jgi:signal transduction histidine kinase
VSEDVEELAAALEAAAKGLRRYRELVCRFLGESEEERRRVARLVAGLDSAEVRVALEEYRKRRGL